MRRGEERREEEEEEEEGEEEEDEEEWENYEVGNIQPFNDLVLLF